MLRFIKKLFQPTDMTVGAPWKSIAMFSLPMIIGNVAQQLYSTVDSMVVGQYLGDDALAAVGSTMPVLNMLYVLFIGISAGVGIMVSQYFGAKAKEELAESIGNCITVTAIATVSLMIITPIVIRPLLTVLNTPEGRIFDWCMDYLLISMLGGIGMAYYNILGGILRGLGDAFWSLIFLLVATVINIGLDIWFVRDLGMEVAGVALATVIAQFISAVLCLVRLLLMRDVFKLKWSNLLIKKRYLGQLVKLGLPSGATQAIFSSAMIVVQSLTNSFGAQFIAANVIVMRVDGFAMMPNFSFGTAMTTFAGQNVGAGKLDRVKVGAKQGTIMALICSAVLTGLILIFGEGLMGLFSKEDTTVELARYLMGILAIGYVAMAVTQSLSGVMRGAGDAVMPMWISLFTTVLVRVPLAYGISFLTRTSELEYGRQECIQISLLASWCIGALLTFLCYRWGRWKKKANNIINR